MRTVGTGCPCWDPSCSPCRPRLNLGIYYRGLKVLPLPLADFSLAYLLCCVRFCFRFRFWVYFTIRTRRGNFAGFMRRSLRSCLRLDVLASMWVSFPVYQSLPRPRESGQRRSRGGEGGREGLHTSLVDKYAAVLGALGMRSVCLRLHTHTLAGTQTHTHTHTLVDTLTAHLAFQMGCAPKSRQCGQVYKLHTHTRTWHNFGNKFVVYVLVKTFTACPIVLPLPLAYPFFVFVSSELTKEI